MGNNETNANRTNPNEITEEPKKNEPIKTTIKNKATSRIEECNISSFEEIEPDIIKITKSICKIRIKPEKNNELKVKSGTGFLLNFYINQELFYCLMSNEHVISEDMIQNKNTIYIYYDNEFKLSNIKLDEKERYIKSFKDISLDVTVVEILDKDNISKDFFLVPESSAKNDDLINFVKN